jgi:hypothetical protein
MVGRLLTSFTTWLDRNRDGVLSRIEVVGQQDTTRPRDQFASLDYDGNGTLARNEWHWSVGSFNARDLNRDGVLSRREFLATAPVGTTGSSPRPFQGVRVNPQQRWTDTGRTVRVGDVLTFTSYGTIQMSSDPNDVATPAGSRTGRAARGAPLRAVAGALIAKIGDSGPILVGDRRAITATTDGRLFLGVNDDHLADNTGEFDVTVSIQPGRR